MPSPYVQPTSGVRDVQLAQSHRFVDKRKILGFSVNLYSKNENAQEKPVKSGFLRVKIHQCAQLDQHSASNEFYLTKI